MSFRQWPQQLHIGLALQKLAEGKAATNIAFDLCYESPSALILLFKQKLVAAPARYLSTVITPKEDKLQD